MCLKHNIDKKNYLLENIFPYLNLARFLTWVENNKKGFKLRKFKENMVRIWIWHFGCFWDENNQKKSAPNSNLEKLANGPSLKNYALAVRFLGQKSSWKLL